MASIVDDQKNENGKAAAHVLFISLAMHEHISPLPKVAIQLVRQGITITFVSFQDAIVRNCNISASGSSVCADQRLLSEAQRRQWGKEQGEVRGTAYLLVNSFLELEEKGETLWLTSRYLVDEVKIATELSTGPQNVFKRKEVERMVRRLVVEWEGKAIRHRVEELQRTATAGVAEGGSKSGVFQEFLEDIRNQKLSSKSKSK